MSETENDDAELGTGTDQSSGEVVYVICGECMLRYEGDQCPNCGADTRWHET